MKDLKARKAIMMVANALYGTMFSQIFLKQLADDLFAPPVKRVRPTKATAGKKGGENA